MPDVSSKLFALCGVDGCGKSTLVAEVGARLKARGIPVVTLKKSMKDNTHYVEEMWSEVKDWSDGPFARAVSVASAYDFLYHFVQCIEPELSADQVVVCDRYAYCYEAYMRCVGADPDFSSMLSGIIQPARTFYIKVPPEIAVARHYERGGPSDDESPEVIRKFVMGYETVFNNMERLSVVDNTLPLETSIETIVSEIETCLSKH